MLEDQPFKQIAHRLFLFFGELPDRLELQRQIVTGAARALGKNQIVQAHMQHLGQPDQGVQGWLRRPCLIAANLIDVQRGGFGQRLLRQIALAAQAA